MLICLLISTQAHSRIIKDTNYITGIKKFSFQEVCKELTKRESPLIEAHSVEKLNCMGEKVAVAKFCDQKEMANPYYARAVVDSENKLVKCYSSKRVILKYKCEGDNDKFCKDHEIGCFLFKEKLAKRLQIAHQSLNDNILNCYYDVKVDMNIKNLEL